MDWNVVEGFEEEEVPVGIAQVAHTVSSFLKLLTPLLPPSKKKT